MIQREILVALVRGLAVNALYAFLNTFPGFLIVLFWLSTFGWTIFRFTRWSLAFGFSQTLHSGLLDKCYESDVALMGLFQGNWSFFFFFLQKYCILKACFGTNKDDSWHFGFNLCYFNTIIAINSFWKLAQRGCQSSEMAGVRRMSW